MFIFRFTSEIILVFFFFLFQFFYHLALTITVHLRFCLVFTIGCILTSISIIIRNDYISAECLSKKSCEQNNCSYPAIYKFSIQNFRKGIYKCQKLQLKRCRFFCQLFPLVKEFYFEHKDSLWLQKCN